MTGKEKAKYRASSHWKDWRRYIIKKRGAKCEVCDYPHKIGLNLHHHDEQNYKDLKEEKFTLLCKRDHQLIENLLSRKSFDIDAYCTNLKRVYLESKRWK